MPWVTSVGARHLGLHQRDAPFVAERAGKNTNNVNDDAKAEKASGEKVENAHAGFVHVEVVCAENTAKEAQNKGHQFAFLRVYDSGVEVGVGIRVGVLIVDDDLGLLHGHGRLRRCNRLLGCGRRWCPSVSRLGGYPAFRAELCTVHGAAVCAPAAYRGRGATLGAVFFIMFEPAFAAGSRLWGSGPTLRAKFCVFEFGAAAVAFHGLFSSSQWFSGGH